jgi:hypothetical protein
VKTRTAAGRCRHARSLTGKAAMVRQPRRHRWIDPSVLA